MAEDETSDPTEQSRWRPLRLLQAAMDADIARIYAEARIDGLKPSFVMELLRLHARGPMTITELAGSVQLTHSAVSQKVTAMRASRAGWRRDGGPPRPPSLRSRPRFPTRSAGSSPTSRKRSGARASTTGSPRSWQQTLPGADLARIPVLFVPEVRHLSRRLPEPVAGPTAGPASTIERPA